MSKRSRSEFAFTCTDGTKITVKANSKRMAENKAMLQARVAQKTLSKDIFMRGAVFTRIGKCGRNGNKPHAKKRRRLSWW